MLETITTYIEQYHLLPASGTVLVAFSGGADSLCLLHLLSLLCGPGKPYPNVHIRAAHLNHMLRGDASDHDATQAATLASQLGLALTIGQVDVPALARQQHLSLEEAARLARYRFLRSVALGSLIAVAHHADDQVETLLLHLLRGAGLTGLIGMRPRQHDIIRPLLAVRHTDTIAYCRQNSLIPIEDASNSDPRFLRNRVRHELVPLLASLNPGIHDTLLHNAAAILSDWQWIETQVDQAWPAIVSSQQLNSLTLDTAALQALHPALQRHLVQRATAILCSGQSPLQLRHYQLIENLLQRQHAGERALHLPGRLRIRHASHTLTIERHLPHHLHEPPAIFSSAPTPLPLPIPGRLQLAGAPWIASAQPIAPDLTRQVRLALRQLNWPEVWRLLPITPHSVYIDGSSLDSGLWVRTRRPGDRIRPLGMTQEKKVQDILVDKHIARDQRASIPLFFSASYCLWIAGVQLDERARLTCATQHIVRLAIEPAS